MVKEDKKEEIGTYLVLSGFTVEGGESVLAGQVIELGERDARKYTAHGWVEKTTQKVGPAPVDPTHRKAIQVRNPKIQDRDPK